MPKDAGTPLYFDIDAVKTGPDIGLLLEGWRGEGEVAVVLSPHDDDALLGTGYLMHTLLGLGAQVHVVIFCRGNAGYTTPAGKDTIVQTREAETDTAYGELGVPTANIHRLGFSDFSANRQLGWNGRDDDDGAFCRIFKLLRGIGATRLLIPNGYREHLDHTAVFDIGRYDSVQATDPILADFGPPITLRSILVYSVWADFSPEDALVSGRDVQLRANAGIVVDEEREKAVDRGLQAYASQAAIIDDLIAARTARRCRAGYVELYIKYDARPKLQFGPYTRWLDRHMTD